MISIFVRIGVIAAIGGAVALAQAPTASASQERVGDYLKRHHVKSYYGKRVRHRRGQPGDDAYRIIQVEPDRGTRVYYAPVRRAPLGGQVRLESGTWQYCEITCEYTFRKYGPDFWGSQAESEIYPRTLKFDFYVDR
jgi:hypothetical protein